MTEPLDELSGSVEEALGFHAGFAAKLVNIAHQFNRVKSYSADQKERFEQVLLEKKDLTHTVSAQEKRIIELQEEVKNLKVANEALSAQIDDERNENSRLLEMLAEQKEDWMTKFAASQEEIEALTISLSNAQITARPPRRPIKEKPQQPEYDPVTEDRQKVLEELPTDRTGDVPEEAHLRPVGFTRLELMSLLGGGGQTLIGNIGKNKEKTEISRVHDVNGMLYPYRDLNPWLPKNPGEHGYMFVGLFGPGGDYQRFLEPEERALFIPVGSSWRYYGHYEVFRDPRKDLSVKEWSLFSGDFKHRYAEMTLSKRMAGSKFTEMKKSKPSQVENEVQQIIREYDAGTRRVPLVQLCCIGYDHGLVLALQEAPKKTVGKRKLGQGTKRTGGASSVASSSHRPSRKRVRTQRAASPQPDVGMDVDDPHPQGPRRSSRVVRLIVREPPADLVDERAESSASDPDEYEDSGSE